MMRLDLKGDENPALPSLKSEAWGAVVLGRIDIYTLQACF